MIVYECKTNEICVLEGEDASGDLTQGVDRRLRRVRVMRSRKKLQVSILLMLREYGGSFMRGAGESVCASVNGLLTRVSRSNPP
jgi:hypothetical protein